MRLLIAMGVAALALCCRVTTAGADSRSDAIETGRLLAILLDSGRVTIAANQALINDPEKGHKGFTGDVFKRQLFAAFQTRTGIDLTQLDQARVPDITKPLLARLIEESKKTVDSYQPAINVPGLRYKGLIPATFGTETAARFQSWSGVYLKQTAPIGLVRNPKNKPDEFETAALEKLEHGTSNGADGILSETMGDTSVRILLPLFYSKSCLGCHGEPKGERDISGYPREGKKEGDLGGAISVKLDFK
ncbi:MAG TPA: DUF3365 domain-containing protein [Nitrospiraceae bacterium]|jgi:hypothetical protein|nr:DUF3365 domain-containing protein [Nitrospiraceae bacterium]